MPGAARNRRIQLIYFNAGGGHRAAALALDDIVRQMGLRWEVSLVNFLEVLDPRGAFRRATGMNPEDLYNKRLARGWTAGLAQELKLLQAMVKLGHRLLVRPLRAHWLASQPDMVVSLVPNFNRPLYESLAAALPGVPYVTVLTDLADYPPNFWIEPGQDQHFICGTPRAVEQARAQGYPASRVHAVSGMIIRGEFYRKPPADRASLRRELDLDPARATGLVMFGGHGARVMAQIARSLDDTQLILVCGHNRALAESLRTQRSGAPRLIVGFSSEIQRYMQASDFFIGKPGPGSLSEAVQQGLPVIVVRNSWTMPQERYNTQWVRDHGLGVVLPSFKQVRAGVHEVGARLDELRANVARVDNRALFEIPVLLGEILTAATGPSAALAQQGLAHAHRSAFGVLRTQ
jgi:UDP-N-acetylglucosamine:LPS N-acetylglucosamine transferase